jgi:hypothetical protein
MAKRGCEAPVPKLSVPNFDRGNAVEGENRKEGRRESADVDKIHKWNDMREEMCEIRCIGSFRSAMEATAGLRMAYSDRIT